MLAPRLLVKYRAGSAELRDVALADRGITAAVARAGVDRAVAASAGSPGRPAASARLLRRSALPRWSVVKTSRPLDGQESAALIRELKANPAVEMVEVERVFKADAQGTTGTAPDDPGYLRYQWNFHDSKYGVHAPQAWAYSQGEGVVVAVVDSGIVRNHPDLQNNVLPGYDMLSDSFNSRREKDGYAPGGWDMGNWVDKDYCLTGVSEGLPLQVASSWHGTHVAGTIAQETNNGFGVAGLAYKAKVLPVRVLGSCGGVGNNIVEGMLWAVGLEVPGVPMNPNPADVVNISLGGSGTCDGFLQEAIDRVVATGAIIVVPAGNDDIPVVNQIPASCNNVITVGATGEDGGKAPYSNFGTRVDISAPGGGSGLPRDSSSPNEPGIWQMVNGGLRGPEPDNWKLVSYNGTSMASPHVAAAVAMIQSAVKTPLTTAQMRTLLQQTASPFGRPMVGGRTMGAGILNIEAALIKAVEPSCFPNCALIAKALSNKVVEQGQTGAAGEEHLYRFDAEAGKVLTIMTYGGAGNVSLFASYNREPMVDDADARSTGPGSSETVRFTVAKAGTYYIKLIGASAYSGVSLVARQ